MIALLHQVPLPATPLRVPRAPCFLQCYNGTALTFLPGPLFFQFSSPRSLCFTPKAQQGPGFPQLFFSHSVHPLSPSLSNACVSASNDTGIAKW